jgi:hypothetical protein
MRRSFRTRGSRPGSRYIRVDREGAPASPRRASRRLIPRRSSARRCRARTSRSSPATRRRTRNRPRRRGRGARERADTRRSRTSSRWHSRCARASDLAPRKSRRPCLPRGRTGRPRWVAGLLRARALAPRRHGRPWPRPESCVPARTSRAEEKRPCRAPSLPGRPKRPRSTSRDRRRLPCERPRWPRASRRRSPRVGSTSALVHSPARQAEDRGLRIQRGCPWGDPFLRRVKKWVAMPGAKQPSRPKLPSWHRAPGETSSAGRERPGVGRLVRPPVLRGLDTFAAAPRETSSVNLLVRFTQTCAAGASFVIVGCSPSGSNDSCSATSASSSSSSGSGGDSGSSSGGTDTCPASACDNACVTCEKGTCCTAISACDADADCVAFLKSDTFLACTELTCSKQAADNSGNANAAVYVDCVLNDCTPQCGP